MFSSIQELYAGLLDRINMALKIEQPTIIEAAGNKPKIIEEYAGGPSGG